ncbi:MULTISPECIES: ABC transporter substrate-binding protein [Ensifer]|uniref:ABC transporter substrate-binding protein n=1 Tax=Ensifer TaxID=106591 RepID=UPI000709386F|nr:MULTISPECIES: ABC transporter substrate-binding protein [Ensifer]KQW54939.1 ABC transporter substrate-binding protein [Ensifer sp. Root127]KQW61686.1 ABC transporter substrate-binding protein [Ensifer sp. Root1252]KRC54450.1 ABC transporter substrate-binding protein [Ensifer sp. Root231]KRD01786.1 ABC transporter substrate-binding protein [Ensifer sp. Root258]MBD9491200.1 ABC transporter substrate-binding protein [Ensifer sp. ENS11]
MVRKLFLVLAAAASALAINGVAWADFTVLVPSSSEGDGLRAAADDYSKMKGTKVEIVQAPYANVFEQGANAGATKSGVFDIILMDDPWIPFFAENGHLEDLTPYFKNAGMEGPDNDFLSKSLAICRTPYNTGPYVCLPYVGNAQMFFYDAAKYKEAGVEAPKTWDDVLKASQTLTKNGGGRYFGYVFRGGQGNPVVADFMPIFWSYGANMFNEDRTKVTIDTPEGAAAMKMFMALRDVSPKGIESYNANEVGTALAAGAAASSINWPNWVATFEDPSQSKMVGKISYAPIPAGTKPGSSEIGHWTMGIMSASKNKQEAFDFMVWATSAEQIKISATRGNPPVRASVFADPELTSQEQFRHYPVLMEAIQASTPRPRHPKWPEIENAFGIELSKAVAGTITPEEALKSSQAAVEEITGLK